MTEWNFEPDQMTASVPGGVQEVNAGQWFEYHMLESSDSDVKRDVATFEDGHVEFSDWVPVVDFTNIPGTTVESCEPDQWMLSGKGTNPEKRQFEGTAKLVGADVVVHDGFTFEDQAPMPGGDIGNKDDPTVGPLQVTVKILVPFGAIMGVVLDQIGEPIYGATVTLKRYGGVTNELTTGQDGSYVFPQLLPGGDYAVDARMDMYTPDPATQQGLTVVRGEATVANLTLTMQPPGGGGGMP